MEVDFTPEQELQISRIANHTGSEPETLVKQAALRWLEDQERFQAAVQEGIAQADRGELIEEAEMDALFEELLRA